MASHPPNLKALEDVHANVYELFNAQLDCDSIEVIVPSLPLFVEGLPANHQGTPTTVQFSSSIKNFKCDNSSRFRIVNKLDDVHNLLEWVEG